jgi:hypothetical protein
VQHTTTTTCIPGTVTTGLIRLTPASETQFCYYCKLPMVETTRATWLALLYVRVRIVSYLRVVVANMGYSGLEAGDFRGDSQFNRDSLRSLSHDSQIESCKKDSESLVCRLAMDGSDRYLCPSHSLR